MSIKDLIQMGLIKMEKNVTNNYFNGPVDISKGNASFGSGGSVVVNSNQELQKLTEDLLNHLSAINNSGQNVDEVKELIKDVAEKVESKKPNKISISSLITTASSAVSLLNQSPNLILSFTKWKDYITHIINNL